MSGYEPGPDQAEHVRQGRRRAVKWAIGLALVVLVFYVGFFFLIDARY